MKDSKSAIRCLLFTVLFSSAFLERTVFDLGPNIELVTMAMILASLYLKKNHVFWLTFAIMATTDRVIGNTPIFIFTWSGFLIPSLFSARLITKLTSRKFPKLFSLTSTGLIANLFFYFWTNFGVWLLDSWNMYPKTAAGLAMSYINALPFLKLHLISSLIFIPAGLATITSAKALYKRLIKLATAYSPQTP
jgi:hypothetical protein